MGFGPPHPRSCYFLSAHLTITPGISSLRKDILHGDIMPRHCPTCKKTLTRISRELWMHRIPGSKHYTCRKCGSAYLLIFNCWLHKRKQTDQKTASPRGA